MATTTKRVRRSNVLRHADGRVDRRFALGHHWADEKKIRELRSTLGTGNEALTDRQVMEVFASAGIIAASLSSAHPDALIHVARGVARATSDEFDRRSVAP